MQGQDGACTHTEVPTLRRLPQGSEWLDALLEYCGDHCDLSLCPVRNPLPLSLSLSLSLSLVLSCVNNDILQSTIHSYCASRGLLSTNCWPSSCSSYSPFPPPPVSVLYSVDLVHNGEIGLGGSAATSTAVMRGHVELDELSDGSGVATFEDETTPTQRGADARP